MLKEKIQLACEFVLKRSKIVFPIIIIVAVAITVLISLKMSNKELETPLMEVAESTDATFERVIQEVPLEENTSGELYTLIATYYNAYATGDVETIKTLTNYMEETDEIKIPEMSKYIGTYPVINIYTKPGPVTGSYLAYVYFQMTFTGYEEPISGMETFYICTNEEGKLYFHEGEVSEDELEYIRVVNLQDDVVELYNRVNVECNETFLNNPDAFYYVQEFVNEVQKTTGETLAAQIMEEAVESEAVEPETQEATEETVDLGPVYAKATTTVNVRASDSEQAERVGKVESGTTVQVLAQQINGWSKIITEGIEGFIKSEFLQVNETVSDGEIIGTITASTNINIRQTASETAEKIGVLAGGESVDLISKENGWCKIRHNGQVGYVKEEFVQ